MRSDYRTIYRSGTRNTPPLRVFYGLGLRLHLKADPALQDIPVIFLTALHNPEDIVKGFKLGASDYVSKPFNHEELITRVSHHIYLAAAQRTIMQQRDELQATVDARDKMYSVIAHDLRSPIGTLKMVFNMLSINLTQQQIGEDNMEMITMGNNITESTFMLLDNLLKWTKSQIGRMNTVFQEVDISEVVVFASKMSDLVAQVKNIAVEYDIPGPITVPCDVDMVKTIMRNLMSNAIKYSNEGGRIVISVRETPTHAVISVRDFGTGISEENLPKLLNPEIHYTTYGTKNEEGSGLGLQLVQDLTRRNGGELTIESTLGEGSTFTFTIAKVPDYLVAVHVGHHDVQQDQVGELRRGLFECLVTSRCRDDLVFGTAQHGFQQHDVGGNVVDGQDRVVLGIYGDVFHEERFRHANIA